MSIKYFFYKNSVAIWTAIISILATIVVGWITVKIGENKYQEVSYERQLKAQEHIVNLIEQNIINQTPLEQSRLKRLIEAKCQELDVNLDLYSIDLIKQAELNLLSSNHLDVKQKELYKLIFDSVYIVAIPEIELAISDSIYINNQDLLNSLLKDIQNCKTSEAMKKVDNILMLYNMDIIKLKNEREMNYKRSDNRQYTLNLYISAASIFFIMILFMMYVKYSRKINYEESSSIILNNQRMRLIVMLIVTIAIIPVYLNLLFSIINK